MYNQIYKSLDLISRNHNCNLYKCDEGYKTHALKDEGFTEILLSKFKINPKYKNDYMQLRIQLNPTKLLNKDTIELTKESDLKEVEKRFNKVIEKIHLDLNTFLFWTLNRVDYAVNISTSYVKEYIELFQRSDIPYRFQILYDKKAKVRKHKEGSYYISNKSTIINFYDKSDERLKKKGEVVESAKDILRLEVQCKKGKTNAMKYKYDFDVKYLGYFLSKELSTETLVNYYYKTIGTGDFYKLDKAIEIINNSGNTLGTKEKLINVLKEVNKSRSIWKARNDTSYSKERFNHYLKLIRELGVNPVTIPRRWEVDYLKNINIYNENM